MEIEIPEHLNFRRFVWPDNKTEQPHWEYLCFKHMVLRIVNERDIDQFETHLHNDLVDHCDDCKRGVTVGG